MRPSLLPEVGPGQGPSTGQSGPNSGEGLRLCQSTNAAVSLFSGEALGAIGDPGVLDVLKQYCADPVVEVMLPGCLPGPTWASLRICGHCLASLGCGQGSGCARAAAPLGQTAPFVPPSAWRAGAQGLLPGPLPGPL